MRAAHTIRSRKRAWKSLRRALARCLENLDNQEYLIISHRGSNRFVQFASDGNGDLLMEATANVYIEQTSHVLTVSDYERMDALGWSRPNRLPQNDTPEQAIAGSSNFYVTMLGTTNWTRVARRTVRTLRDVYDIRHPRQLDYAAFHVDGTNIRFPTLGLVSRAAIDAQKDQADENASQMWLDGLPDDSDDDLPFHN